MADLTGESSNRLFQVLEGWERHLASLDSKSLSAKMIHSRHIFNEIAKPEAEKFKYPPPFSLRLTYEERAPLDAERGEKTFASHIRDSLPDPVGPCCPERLDPENRSRRNGPTGCRRRLGEQQHVHREHVDKWSSETDVPARNCRVPGRIIRNEILLTDLPQRCWRQTLRPSDALYGLFLQKKQTKVLRLI